MEKTANFYEDLQKKGFGDRQILAYLEDGQALAETGISDQEMVEDLHDLLSKKIADEKNALKLAEGMRLHEKMKNCFFWDPPLAASQRRDYEVRNSKEIEIPGYKLEWKISTQCSCRNIYFASEIMVDGCKKDIRAIKKIIKSLKEKNI
jgi:hypothetical protein